MKRAMLLCGVLMCGFAGAQTLTWNPAVSGVWDATSENWLDGATPSAWVQGASAVFDGAGGFVEVATDVEASGVTFASGNYALVGYGRIRLEGVLDVAAGMTNSVGTELFSLGGVTKTGPGAVALGKCVGPVTVSGGDLLATSSELADAQVTVEAGGRVVTTGEPGRGMANLIVNGGFEAVSVAAESGRFRYVSQNASLLPGWGVVTESARVGVENVDGANSSWNSAGTAPEGVQMLILQQNGAVTQQVAVASAGWHQVAFHYLLRANYPETLMYVTLDGVPLVPVFNDVKEFFPRRFVSVPFWLEPGEHVLGFAGEGNMMDCTSIIDDVVLGPAFNAGGMCRSLGGDSSVTLETGAAAVLNHNGSLEVARLDDANGSVTGSGGWGGSPWVPWGGGGGGGAPSPVVRGEVGWLRVRGGGPTLALQGEARHVWVSGAASGLEITGGGLVLTNTAAQLPARFSVSDDSDVRVSAPEFYPSLTMTEVFGSLAFEGWASLKTNAVTFNKRGFGEVAFAYPLRLDTGNRMNVFEGRLSVAHIASQMTSDSNGLQGYPRLMSVPGRTAEMCLTQPGVTHSLGAIFCGSGQGVLSVDVGGGRVDAGHLRTLTTAAAEFQVAEGDTLGIRQLLIWSASLDKGGGLLKSGGGTLEIREGGLDAGNNRAHRGEVTLRNGTLRVLVDDTGNLVTPLAFNGSSPDGRGGSLGFSPLKQAVRVGDGGTLPTDNLTFTAVGNKRYIGHDFEIFDFGNDVRFEVEDSTETMFAGTFTLHRGMTFAGPPGAHLILGGIEAVGVADVTFEGFGHVTFLGDISGDINLDMGGCELVFSPSAAAELPLNAFSMGDGGVIHLNVEGGCAIPLISADTVTLGEVAFGLYYFGTDIPFAEPGTYTLMTGTTITADPLALSVANEVPGFSYAFAVSGGALTVTIAGNTPGALTVWAKQGGGAWETDGNWNTGTAPDDPLASAWMGGAITQDAAVTLGAPFDVGALTFNTRWGYTLGGAPLTFGSPARIDVLNGSHTIANTLDTGGGPLNVAVTGGSLTLDGTGGALAKVLLEQGGGALTLAGNASLAGGAEVADGATLAVSGTNTVSGSLGGAPGGTLTVQGGGRLTVDQTQGGVFSGEVRLGGPPVSLVAALDPLIWWDPSDTATVTLSGGRVIGLVNKGVGGGAFDAVVRTSVPGFVGPTYVTGINSYSGLPMLRIDTNGQGLESASNTGISGNAPRTLIAVMGRAANNTTLDVTLGTGVNDQRFGLLHYSDGQTRFPSHGNDIAIPGQPAGIPTVLSAYNGVGGYLSTWQGFQNGVPSAPKTSTAMNTLNTPLYIGYLFNSVATVSERGQVGEVLLFDRTLTPAERELVEAYLIAKWKRTGVGTLGVNSTELVKAGAGTWTLDNPGTMFGGTFRQTEGETVLKGASLLGEVSVEGGTGLTFAPAATNGLMGYYYDFYPATPSAFLTVEGVEGLIAGYAPVLISPSGLDNSDFAYPVTGSAGLLFPYPFGGGGPNTVNFIAVWRGSITVPETGIYGFRMVADDHALLALDGTPVISITTSTSDTAWVCRSAELTAGRHDILIGLEQGAGNAGIRLSVCEPSSLTGAYVPVPNSWLTPMSTVGAIDHLAGQVTVQGGANVRIGEKGPGTLDAALDIGAGGLLEKSGNNRLEIKGGAWNQVEGDVSVRAGRLALTDPDWSVPAARMAVHDGATLFLTSHGTVGGLSGKGLTLIGSEGGEGVDIFPFTDETDSGISPLKRYTHLVDLPLTQGTVATVNGVTFNTGGMNWSYVAGTTPTASQSANTEVGIERLLRGFLYGQTDYTIRLTGLKPFTAHEFRLYNRNYSNGNRNVTYTFTAGANLVGDVYYNVDSIMRSQVRCRYITDAAGTLDVRVYSHVGTDTCHFYAFSNEEIGGEAFFDPAAARLTVDSPAGSDTRYEGIITGSGTLVKSGDGTQRFSGAINLDGAFTIGGGETVLECGATVKGAPEVEAPATLFTPIGGVTLGGITGNGTLKMSNPEGNLYRHFFTNDVGSLISPTKVYTHKLDFGARGGTTVGGPGAVVNDVEFVKAASSGTANGYGWSGFGSQTHAGNANTGITPTTEKAHALLTDMVYNIPTGTATLTGLTPGKQYELRIYNRMWVSGEWRGQEASFSSGPGPSAYTSFFEDQMALHFLAYRYTPATDTLTISYNNFGPAATWHFYALTNEELTNEDWNSVVFDMADDSVFGGTVTGHQHWTKRGAGTLLMTGVNTATGPLTVESGAFGVGAGGVATEGPVSVMDGAQLFGQGTVGGAVQVADGAWIQAGEAGVCGTLTIGGDLFLAEGANIAFRYASTASADTFIVGGVLTLPQTGVIASAPLTPGTTPPSRWTLFGTAGTIDGPPDFSGWTIDGIPRAKLSYSADKKRVDIITSEGTILLLR